MRVPCSANPLPHLEHLKGFSPVWWRMWRTRAPFSRKPREQCWHTYGLSSACVRWWTRSAFYVGQKQFSFVSNLFVCFKLVAILIYYYSNISTLTLKYFHLAQYFPNLFVEKYHTTMKSLTNPITMHLNPRQFSDIMKVFAVSPLSCSSCHRGCSGEADRWNAPACAPEHAQWLWTSCRTHHICTCAHSHAPPCVSSACSLSGTPSDM